MKKDPNRWYEKWYQDPLNCVLIFCALGTIAIALGICLGLKLN